MGLPWFLRIPVNFKGVKKKGGISNQKPKTRTLDIKIQQLDQEDEFGAEEKMKIYNDAMK